MTAFRVVYEGKLARIHWVPLRHVDCIIEWHLYAYNVQYESATNGRLSPFFMRKLGAFSLLEHEAHSTLKPDALSEQIGRLPGHVL